MKYLLLLLGALIQLQGKAADKEVEYDYHFSSIELLVEQEVGRIVLPAIYSGLGLRIKIEPFPAQRAQFLANSGGNDGEIMRIFTYGNENPNTIRVPTPYYQLETMAFVRAQDTINIESKSDLANYKVAKVRGVKHTNNITVDLPDVYEASSTENMFKLLLNDVVDVVLTNTMDGNFIMEKMGYKDIVSMNKPLAYLPLFHYVHKSNAHLVAKIDQEILRLTNNGELDNLIKQAEKSVLARSSR